MKRFILASIVALGMMTSVNAQLIVLENGQTQLGNSLANSDLNPKATLNIWEISRKYGGSISFGKGTDAMIRGDGATGSLGLTAKTSFVLGVGNNVSAVTFTTSSKTFKYSFDIQAPSFLTTSDVRFKTNISSLDGLSKGIIDLNPVSYNLNFPVITDSLAAKDKANKAIESINDDRIHYGFVAQEVREIFPELVVEDEDGMLSIDYTGFIPLLVEAYKELSEKVKEQEETIMALINPASPSYMPASINSLSDNKPLLKQNRPNPFNYVTTIECYLPQDVKSSYLCIYDLQGKQMLKVDINERGAVNAEIEASSLAPGMYIYSLIADGNEIDSKRMIITD